MNEPFNPVVDKIKRYVHQPLTIEHYGIHASIQANGRVILRSIDKNASTKEEVVYDEIDVPASLVFKLASLLKATRNIEYVAVQEPTVPIVTG